MESLISKMRKHFCPYGIIMYSKHCDYYKTNPITQEEIKMYYDLLNSNNNLPPDTSKPNHLTCCLYYLSKDNTKFRNIMYQTILPNLKKNNNEIKLNDNNLFLTYNIIDYSERYLRLEPAQLKELLSQLEIFQKHNKTFENYLLYKYYRGLLLLNLNRFDEAYSEYLEIVSGLADEEHKKNDYTDFIKLKNDLFYLRLIEKDPREQSELLKTLFSSVQKKDKLLAIKLGFGLYKSLYEQNKLSECLTTLNEMKKMLTEALRTGTINRNGIDYYLAISSRVGFIGVLTNNKEAVNSGINKIDELLKVISRDNQTRKLSMLIKAYTFVNAILRINNHLPVVGRPKDIASKFRAEFMPSYPDQIIQNNFIVTKDNVNECFIDIYAFNHSDNNCEINSKKIIDSYMTKMSKNIPLPNSMIVVVVIGIENFICRYSELFCTNTNRNTQLDSLNKIIFYGNSLFNYIKICYSYEDNKSIFQSEFIKSAIIKIYSSYTHAYLYNKNYEMVQRCIADFDEICRKLRINDSTPSYELILKIKGDYWFYKKSYKDSLEYYNKAIKLMDENNPKKPIIYFNLGCLYYINNNKNNAIDNLVKCIQYSTKIEQNEKSSDFYRTRQNRKIEIAKSIFKKLNNQ